MRVTVISIKENEAVLVRGTSAFGMHGTFGCPLVVGAAVFIPSRGFEDNLRSGNTIEVETGYETVSDARLQAGEAIESMEPIGDVGDYLIKGRIVWFAPQGRVRVSVRGLLFTLERDDLGELQLEVGKSMQFRLSGLSLWDTAV